MPEPARKPPVAMESRDPKSIRFTPTEWDKIRAAADDRGLEPAVFVRLLTIYALSIVQAPVLSEASLGIPGLSGRASAQGPSGSRGTRRF